MKLDDVALEAAAKALRGDRTSFTTAEEYARAKTKVAISAYFTALEADGLAHSQTLFRFPNTVSDYRTTPPYGEYENVPVTIIRERPDAKAPGN